MYVMVMGALCRATQGERIARKVYEMNESEAIFVQL